MPVRERKEVQALLRPLGIGIGELSNDEAVNFLVRFTCTVRTLSVIERTW